MWNSSISYPGRVYTGSLRPSVPDPPIKDLLAVKTHEMMMLVDLGIEPGGRPWMTDLRDQMQTHERIKHAIHSCLRHARQAALDYFVPRRPLWGAPP